MYRKILFCLDNSDLSLAAASLGLKIAAHSGASVTGCHVYAARLHNERFRQMEGVLPPQYQEEEKLKDQRDVHDTLITKGLKIISGSYMDVFTAKASLYGLTPRCVSREGKNFEEIVREAKDGSYDLIVMGAHGLGKTEFSRIGSVCERVARRVDTDILIAQNEDTAGPIVSAIDGSPLSFGGLKSSLYLSRVFGNPVEAVSAFDPDYHQAAFRSIAGVLSEEAGRLFRFKEQEKLHEEIIDKGLARIYDGHLKTASAMAEKEGVSIKTALLSGKPFNEIIKYARKKPPFMLVLGKTGAHSSEGLDIGSTTENCLRESGSNILISSRPFTPEPGEAEKKTGCEWTAEAKAILSSIPAFARGIVRNMVEDSARRDGVRAITAVYMRAVRKKMEGD